MADAHTVPRELARLDVESHAPYMKVWAVLAVLTLVEYFYAHDLQGLTSCSS